VSTSVVKCSWVKCSESLSNRVPNIIRRYIDHTKFAAFMVLLFIIFLRVLFFNHCIFFVHFCLILYVMYSHCCVYVFSVLYILFHRANWHSSATLTEVSPCFFLSCKTNARLQHAKTGHGPHSSQVVSCVVLCIVCVNCVVLCIVCM
jgi:hypothetical protein